MNGWRGGKRIEDWGVIHKAIQMCAEITVSGVKRRSIVNDCKKDSKKRNVPISSEHLFMKSGSVCELHHVIHELHICSNMSGDHKLNLSIQKSKGKRDVPRSDPRSIHISILTVDSSITFPIISL